MKSVFVCALLVALAQHAFAGVCDTNIVYNSTLVTPCLGNDVAILWPNYLDFTTYYKCVDFGKPELKKCPPNSYFVYVFQRCDSDCKRFIPAPPCESLEQTTDVTCIPNTTPAPTPTTAKPTAVPTTPTTPRTTKAPPTTVPGPDTPTPTPTTDKTPKPTKVPSTPATKPPTVTSPPMPPTQAPSGIPTPPTVATPAPNVPTPPSQGITPPILGTPPSYVPPPQKA